MIAGCIAVIFSIKSLNRQSNNEDEQIKQGVEIIKNLEKQDVVQVEEKIASIKAQNGITDQPVATTDDQDSSGKVSENNWKTFPPTCFNFSTCFLLALPEGEIATNSK